jgi:hypothetical protein
VPSAAAAALFVVAAFAAPLDADADDEECAPHVHGSGASADRAGARLPPATTKICTSCGQSASLGSRPGGERKTEIVHRGMITQSPHGERKTTWLLQVGSTEHKHLSRLLSTHQSTTTHFPLRQTLVDVKKTRLTLKETNTHIHSAIIITHTLVDVKEDARHVAARERDRVFDAGEIDERQALVGGALRCLLDELATELRQNVAILAVLRERRESGDGTR